MDTSLEQFVSEEQKRALFRPTADAFGLPGEVYYSEAFWELERRRWFSRTWMACAFETDLPTPGSVFPVQIAGWDLILTRDLQGEIHAFHNICPHRGMRVVNAACEGVRRIACPWHRWTYDLEGRLIATPNFGGMRIDESEGVDLSEVRLAPVRSATWLNVVFVDLSSRAPPLKTHLAPLIGRLRDYDLSSLEFSGQTISHVFQSNWKLVIEGGVEDYHLPWVHPQEWVADNLYYPEHDDEDCYVGFTSRYPPEDDDKTLRHPDANAVLPDFPHHRRNLPEDGYGPEGGMFVVPPSIAWMVLPTTVVPTLLIPVRPDQTLQRRTFLYIGDAATDDRLGATRRASAAGHATVAAEDSAIADVLHKMQRQRGEVWLPSRFSPYWEEAVHHFQKMVVRKLEAP